MSIRRPTNLFLNFSADLQVDQGNGRSLSQNLIGYTEQIPYSSYSTGSLELLNSDPEKSLGELTSGIFTANAPIEFRVGNNTDVITSRSFSYNGDLTTIYVNNTSINPVTVEYIFGTKI
jgi:hypothetical protein